MNSAYQPTFLGKMIAIAIGMLLTLAIAEVAARLAFPNWREFYSGWFMTATQVSGYGQVVIGTPGFNGHFAQNNGDFRVRIRVNDFGLRNDEPVSAAHHRIWTIGDSMTFGWGVDRDDAFVAVAGRESGMPVYNVAAPGASVCGYQALSARMPDSIRPLAVVVGLVIENDLDNYDCAKAATVMPEPERIDHSIRTLKYYLTGQSALYNSLAVGLKRVAMVERLLEKAGLIAPLSSDRAIPGPEERSMLAESTVAELIRLRDMFPHIPFSVLIIPARHEIKDDDPTFRDLRERVEDRLSHSGISYLDPIEDLKRAGFRTVHFDHDGHWNEAGHKIAGELVARWIKDLRLGGSTSAAEP